jgi:hypothetical protein
MFTMDARMPASPSGRITWTLLWLLVAIAAGAALVFFLGTKPPTPAPTPTTVASSQPATTQSVATTTTAPTIQTYGQLLHADLHNYPTTQPWGTPVDLADAAHIILNEPTYVCSRGDLWITRPDADPLPIALARAVNETEHIVDRPVSYIIWTPDLRGVWHPSAVCPTDNGYEIITPKITVPITFHRHFLWNQAMTWQDNDTTRLIVPTDTGISIITINLTPGETSSHEDYVELTPAHSTILPIQSPAVLFDTRGLLAWIPADQHFAQTSVARYLDGKWTKLDAAAWPGDIVYLIPLLDGSVLQIHRGEGDSALTFVSLDSPDISEKEISDLVDQLGDDDPDKRVAAYSRLSQYGPKINPILQKLAPNAAPEAKARMQELLRKTTLGGMSVNNNELHVVARLRDGGMIFSAPQGVTIPQEGEDPKVVNPDYLAVRPGRPVQELPPAVVDRLSKQNGKVTAWSDEWLVTDSSGPQRFLPPDQLAPLLYPTERNFARLAAIDSRGRWLFADDDSHRTLILDPTVPDPTPRLAIWLIDGSDFSGWTKNDYPAFKRGTAKWFIDDHDFEPIDQSEKILDKLPKPPQATTNPSGPLLLVEPDGTRYYDGIATITIVSPNGHRQVWPLPDECAGSYDQPAYLASDHQGHFFLLNSIGRIVRLRATPNGSAPFILEAVFSDHVPDLHDIKRVWLDPAGRIDVAYADSYLILIFPTGQIPREIEDKILIQDLRRINAP